MADGKSSKLTIESVFGRGGSSLVVRLVLWLVDLGSDDLCELYSNVVCQHEVSLGSTVGLEGDAQRLAETERVRTLPLIALFHDTRTIRGER